MANSIYNEVKPTQQNDFLTQFTQFRQMFTGNPQTQVQQLLQSGRMSQEQFNQLAEQATQLRQLLK
jgi:hypothetical protein